MKKVDISRFCAWKIFGKYIWNLTNPNTIPIITKKSTNTCLFKDPKYKYNNKYANSKNDKHKYDNFCVFGVWNNPKFWYPKIFVPNYAGPWDQGAYVLMLSLFLYQVRLISVSQKSMIIINLDQAGSNALSV